MIPITKKLCRYSWSEQSCITINELVLIEPCYFGFDEKVHQGAMIIHKKVAEEVLEIFEQLCAYRYPIEKVRLIDEYEGSDERSMADNNSYSFCYREALNKPGVLSMHSYGLAVDINPLYNPYIKNGCVVPDKAKNYVDRRSQHKAMIMPQEICHTLFEKRGWEWGGMWKDRIDYHHFEKRSALGL